MVFEMTERSQLRAFISSRMEELLEEREVIKSVLAELNIQAWKFESDAGARPETIQETYLKELKNSDFYIGIFWQGYGQYTIDEYYKACDIGMPCFVYEKRTNLEDRETALQLFLDEISSVTHGRTIQWFTSTNELKDYVKRDVTAWSASLSRRSLNAVSKEKQQKQRDIKLKRSMAVIGLFLALILLSVTLITRINGQHCSKDRAISQYGAVHIFETHIDENGLRWWLQKPTEGFLSIAPSLNFEYPLRTKDAKYVLDVQYDQSRDYIWVGTSGRGLIRLVKQGSEWIFDKKFDLNSGLTNCNIQTILVDRQRVYLGTLDSRNPALIFSDDGETWQQTAQIPHEGENKRILYTFYSLESDGSNVWAGTTQGLYRFDGTEWFGPYEPEFSGNKISLRVRDIAIGSENVKWIATEGNGLLLLDNSSGRTSWLRVLGDFGIENVYSLDLFSSGKQALIGTQYGLFKCNLGELDSLNVECEVIDNKDTIEKPIYSIAIASDDSQVLLGVDDELVSLSFIDINR